MLGKVGGVAVLDAQMARMIALFASRGVHSWQRDNGYRAPAEVLAFIDELRALGETATTPTEATVTPAEEPEWITVADAAERAGVTKQAVHKWCATGKVTSRHSAGRVLVDATDVDWLIAEREAVNRYQPGSTGPTTLAG